jgi:hypothetical protein
VALATLPGESPSPQVPGLEGFPQGDILDDGLLETLPPPSDGSSPFESDLFPSDNGNADPLQSLPTTPSEPQENPRSDGDEESDTQ